MLSTTNGPRLETISLKDVEILPIQGLSWQTNLVVFDKLFHVFTTGKYLYLEILSCLTILSFSFKILQLMAAYLDYLA